VEPNKQRRDSERQLIRGLYSQEKVDVHMTDSLELLAWDGKTRGEEGREKLGGGDVGLAKF